MAGLLTALRARLSTALRARRRGTPTADARRVLAPAARELIVAGSGERQNALASCDRSPALLRLQTQEDHVQVWFAGTVEVGHLDDSSAPAFRRAVRRSERHGEQLWVHGQVQRRGVELCVVLHCDPPATRKGPFSPKKGL